MRLLRMLLVHSNRGRIIYKEVLNPHHMSLANTFTDVVEINIISIDDGEFVPSKGGKFIMTVHVRKCQHR